MRSAICRRRSRPSSCALAEREIRLLGARDRKKIDVRGHLRHPPGSARRHARRHLPRGPVLPPQRPRSTCRAARPRRGPVAAMRALPGPRRPALRQAARRHQPAALKLLHTPGRATSASWKTSSSAVALCDGPQIVPRTCCRPRCGSAGRLTLSATPSGICRCRIWNANTSCGDERRRRQQDLAPPSAPGADRKTLYRKLEESEQKSDSSPDRDRRRPTATSIPGTSPGEGR